MNVVCCLCVVQGLEEELEEVRMKKEAVDAQVGPPHILPSLPLIRLIRAHGQDAKLVEKGRRSPAHANLLIY